MWGFSNWIKQTYHLERRSIFLFNSCLSIPPPRFPLHSHPSQPSPLDQAAQPRAIAYKHIYQQPCRSQWLRHRRLWATESQTFQTMAQVSLEKSIAQQLLTINSGVVTLDPWLEPFKDSLRSRFAKAQSWIKTINDTEGGLEKFSRVSQKLLDRALQMSSDLIFRDTRSSVSMSCQTMMSYIESGRRML